MPQKFTKMSNQIHFPHIGIGLVIRPHWQPHLAHYQNSPLIFTTEAEKKKKRRSIWWLLSAESLIERQQIAEMLRINLPRDD